MYENYVHYLPFGHTIARILLPYYLSWFYKQLNGAIAPSQAVYRTVHRLTHALCEIIPSSINPLYIQAHTKKIFDQNRPLSLMTASRLVPEKNIGQLLKACALLKVPFQLMICGDGYMRNELESLAYQHYKFSKEQIRFIGELDSVELAAYYRAADIFVFASQSETQGLVIGEAMACGTPVIAFRGPGVEDALRDGGGILVENAEDMAHVIMRCYSEFSYLSSLNNQTKHCAEQYFPMSIVKNLIDFYNNITGTTNSWRGFF